MTQNKKTDKRKDVKHTPVFMDRDLFRNYQELLAISDLSEADPRTIAATGAKRCDKREIASGIFSNDVRMDLSLCSGMTNYWIETTFRTGDDSTTLAVTEPSFELKETGFSAEYLGNTYVLDFVFD